MKNEAYEKWWGDLTKQGDPLRRPNLTREAFEAGQRSIDKPAPIIKPIPKALYSCSWGCAADHSWPAADLYWSDKVNKWVCIECWEYGTHGYDHGISLADELKSMGKA